MFVNSALPRLEQLVTPVLPRGQNSMFLNSAHGGPEIPGTTCNRKLISTSDSGKAVLMKDKGPLGSKRTNCISILISSNCTGHQTRLVKALRSIRCVSTLAHNQPHPNSIIVIYLWKTPWFF
jgi:hypothetical protein